GRCGVCVWRVNVRERGHAPRMENRTALRSTKTMVCLETSHPRASAARPSWRTWSGPAERAPLPPFGSAAVHPRRWVGAQGPGADGGPRDISRALDGLVPKMVAIEIATIQRITMRM